MAQRNSNSQDGSFSDPVPITSNGAPSSGQAVHDFFSTDEIFKRVAATADEEIGLPTQLMFISGLAAGLSIGLSFYARAAVTAQVPDTPLIGNIFYPIGFLLIVIGRYQLFTENTLTPVTLVLTRLASIPTLLRVWGTVLFANVVGAVLLAMVLAFTPLMSAEATEIAMGFWEHAAETSWTALLVKGIMAGWLVASMVWLVHAARDTISRVLLVVFMMFLIPSADLYHCIIGLCEAAWAFFIGAATFSEATLGFFLPVLIGNTIGGVTLVAFLNYSMTRDSRFPDRDCGQLELSWQQMLFEFHAGTLEEEELRLLQRKPLRTPITEKDHIWGNPDATITLVHYGDYECPTSRKISDIVEDLEHHLDVDYRFVFRHMPLSRRHPHAVHAAMAAETASEQDAFWQMHDKLFRNQAALRDIDLTEYARALKLDLDLFQRSFDDPKHRERIEHDRKDALRNDVRWTSNLFINGQRYVGEWSVIDVVEAIHKITAEQQRGLQPV